jgi:hypothetical protein
MFHGEYSAKREIEKVEKWHQPILDRIVLLGLELQKFLITPESPPCKKEKNLCPTLLYCYIWALTHLKGLKQITTSAMYG